MKEKQKNLKKINSKKNGFAKAISYLFFITILIFSSCNKGDTQSNCGCGSETLYTIPNDKLQIPIEVQKSGLLFFKDNEIIDSFVPEGKWEDRYWIFQGTDGCYNCQRKFIVCNEGLLDNQFDFLRHKNNSDSIKVLFSGNVMVPCGNDPFIAPADYYYAEIVITSIERQ